MTQSVDTLQNDMYRSMTGSERLDLAVDLSLTARALAISRLRAIHPDWSDADLRIELLRCSILPKDLPWNCDD